MRLSPFCLQFYGGCYTDDSWAFETHLHGDGWIEPIWPAVEISFPEAQADLLFNEWDSLVFLDKSFVELLRHCFRVCLRAGRPTQKITLPEV